MNVVYRDSNLTYIVIVSQERESHFSCVPTADLGSWRFA
jgi:hypothetical protein